MNLSHLGIQYIGLESGIMILISQPRHRDTDTHTRLATPCHVKVFPSPALSERQVVSCMVAFMTIGAVQAFFSLKGIMRRGRGGGVLE